MIKIYKNLISFFSKFFRLFHKSVTIDSFIANHEQFLSLKIPYMSKRATEFIENLIDNKKYLNCYEWGSGGSTLWLEKQLSSVISVEESELWFDYLKNMINQNKTKLVLINPMKNSIDSINNQIKSQKKGFKNKNYIEYVDYIDNFNKFDLIIIDGRVRKFCLKKALNHINENGAIVFDDTYRKRYKKIIQSLDPNLYKVKNIYGLSRFQLKLSKVSIITVKS